MKKRIRKKLLPIFSVVGLMAIALLCLFGFESKESIPPDQAAHTVEAVDTTTPFADAEEMKDTEEETMEEIAAVVNRASDEVIKIYIDQGHCPTGTWNTGAVWNGIFEHDKNFEVGILLYELLKDDPRFDVRLSRPTAGTVLGNDNNTALNARSAEANAWGADYFISIHCNAAPDMLARGVESFSRADNDEGFALGLKLVEAICEATGFDNRGTFARPELSVLRKTEMPAVLVELGFLSNPAEAAMLTEHPALFAEALHKGILAYFGFSES
ncbi:MAG: N-acetylmuramoyl-L-alanine amidase [Clostridia bacterium]|nr:N-acetylmuramoyl-L-alanine amidase [Clostridia bacterium]